MVELPLIFVTGLLGSAHCIGMCGPFAIALGADVADAGALARRQIAFTLGRIFTYATLGAAAGFFGLRIVERFPWLSMAPAVLCIGAGVALVYEGFKTAGLAPNRVTAKPGSVCLSATFLRRALRLPGGMGAFVAGLFVGLLPCGLVYAYLAMAASRTHLLEGAAVMAAFGAGTAPVMLLTGLSAKLVTASAREKVLKFAAVCAILAGCAAMVRGAAFLAAPATETGCPMCG